VNRTYQATVILSTGDVQTHTGTFDEVLVQLIKRQAQLTGSGYGLYIGSAAIEPADD
jgi:hypothetical protein